jgi:hypothetical protein
MLTDPTSENDAKGGWILDTEPMTAYSWLLAFEGGVLEGNNYRFLTPNNITAFQFLKKLSEDGCTWQANGDPFRVCQAPGAVHHCQPRRPAGDCAASAADNSDQWTVLAYPGELQALASMVLRMCCWDRAKEQRTWIFIRWMLTRSMTRLVETTHLFPLRTTTALLTTENFIPNGLGC